MREGGERHRIISAFPHCVSVLEMIFFKPFFEHFEDNIGKTWYSYSSTWVQNSEVWKQFQEFDNVVEIDYVRFDITVAGQLLHMFYSVFEDMLILTPLQRKIYRWVRDYHMHAVVLNSSDREVSLVRDKVNSLFSGAVVTNLCGS
jgi:hypothetical protein